MCQDNSRSQPRYINPHKISKFMTTTAHGDSVPHWEVNACRVCLSGKGDNWYDVPFAVHHLSVGSTFTLRFEQISGRPVIACKVPEGAGPDSIFRVHIPPSVVQLILDTNAMNRLPLGEAVKDVSAADNRFNVIFRPDFLGLARNSPPSNQRDEECTPAVQPQILQGQTELDHNPSLPSSRSSQEVDSPTIEGAMEMDRNASLPTSIPVLNSQLPCSPVTQTSLDLALFLQSMETFRANRLLGVIESPPMNQSAAIEAIESSLVEEDKDVSEVAEAEVLRLVSALEECNEGDNNREDGDRNPDNLTAEEKLNEEDKDDEALLQKVSHLVWESKNDEFGIQQSTTADNRKPAATPSSKADNRKCAAKKKAPGPATRKSPRNNSTSNNNNNLSLPSSEADNRKPAAKRKVTATSTNTRNKKEKARNKAPESAGASCQSSTNNNNDTPNASNTPDPPSIRRTRGLPDNDEVTDETGPAMATTGILAIEEEEREAMENEDVCCYTCGKTPCEWLEYGVEVLDAIEKRFDCSEAKSNGYVVEIGSDNHVQNNKIRFSLYRMFTYEKFGCLGKGNRMKIPDCVESRIKELFPDLDGNYTNFDPENET